MSRMKLPILAAVAAVALPLAPAVADDAEVTWAGCGLADVANTRDTRTSLIYASPLIVADMIDDESDGGTTLSPANPVTIVCAVQTQAAYAPSAVLATVYSSPGIGASVLQPRTVSYTASSDQASFVCSGFWFKAPDGTWIHKWSDSDGNESNGVTCAPSASLGSF